MPSFYTTDTTHNTLASRYIHFPQSDSDQRLWLCINKVPQTYNINHLATQINDIHPDIKVEGIHRKQSTTYQTTLILFKTSNEITQNLLLHHSIQINQSTSQITKYIPKTQTRCTNCQKLGHLRKQCKQVSRCMRCAGYSCLPQLQKRIQEMRKLWTKSFSIIQKLPHTQTTYTRQLHPKTTKNICRHCHIIAQRSHWLTNNTDQLTQRDDEPDKSPK